MVVRCAGPWRAVQAGIGGERHQRVVARMKLDLVAAPADAIMRVQLRRVHVREPRVRLHLRGAERRAESAQLFGG